VSITDRIASLRSTLKADRHALHRLQTGQAVGMPEKDGIFSPGRATLESSLRFRIAQTEALLATLETLDDDPPEEAAL
jgi:hypothetical protein